MQNTIELTREKLDSLKSTFFNKSLPTKLVHYTDAAGLLGILNSQKMWGTHAFYLNDATEIYHIQELVENISNELIDQYKPNEIGQTDDEHAVWRNRDFLFRLSYKSLREKPNPDIYVTCFCENDDLLSQWRGYGAGGAGYAICFDGKQFKETFPTLKLRKVIYTLKDQEEIIRELLDIIFNSFKNNSTGMSVEEASLIADEYALLFEKEITKYSPFFKNPSFQEENEWRLTFSNEENNSSKNINFRTNNLGIIPYVEIDSSSDILPITEIRIGPSGHSILAEKALRMVTNERAMNIAISGSTVPLRA